MRVEKILKTSFTLLTCRSEMEYKGYISHLNYTYEKITKSNESLAVVRARMSSEGEKITTL